MTILHEPRENTQLVGHADAEKRLLDAWKSARLPHGWLISGPRGIGKATLAFRFARFVLAGGQTADLALAADHPVARRVASGGHADLHVVERGLTEDGKRMQLVIPVDAIRAAGQSMTLTAGEGGWRVLIVDGAEEMNVNAANALLKLLEEPPARSLILLVSHAPGRLLPTIHSRCCGLRLAPLACETVDRLLATWHPAIGEADRERLAGLSDGSIGRALALADSDGLAVHRELVTVLAGLPRLDVAAAHAFADRFARADDAWRTAVDLTARILAGFVSAGARGTGLEGYGREDTERLDRLRARASLDRWLDVWEKTTRLFARADAVNLDRKQVMLDALGAIESAAAG